MLLPDRLPCITKIISRLSRRGSADKASITLEAAIVMPFFVAFLLVMIAMVKVAMLQMALQGAVNETVKQLATHAYPAYVIQADLVDAAGETEWGKAFLESVDSAGQVWSDVKEAESLVQSVGINLNITGPIEQAIKQFIDSLACAAAEPVVEAYADTKILDPANLTVSRVMFNNEFLGIEAQYHYKMVVPFFKPDLILRAQAAEKLWNQFTNYDRGAAAEKKPMQFIGSINSNKYHIIGNNKCIGVRSIKEPNLLGWRSETEAIEAGYVRCKICWPQHN